MGTTRRRPRKTNETRTDVQRTRCGCGRSSSQERFKPISGQVSIVNSKFTEPYHEYDKMGLQSALAGRKLYHLTKYAMICALRALDRGWRLLPADPYKAIKLKRTPSWKESRLAVTVLRNSASGAGTESKWKRLEERINHEFETIYQIKPRRMATHVVCGATEPIGLAAPVETELALSPLGAPVMFLFNGHEGMTTTTAHWTKYQIDHPHLTIFLAIRMAITSFTQSTKEDKNPPLTQDFVTWLVLRYNLEVKSHTFRQ